MSQVREQPEVRPGVRCHACGYDLRGRRYDDVCPECARPVALSLCHSLSQSGTYVLRWLAIALAGSLIEATIPVAIILTVLTAFVGLGSATTLTGWVLQVAGPVIALAALFQATGFAICFRRLRSNRVHPEVRVLRNRQRRNVLIAIAATAVGAVSLALVTTLSLPFLAQLGLVAGSIGLAFRHLPARRALDALTGYEIATDVRQLSEMYVFKGTLEFIGLPALAVASAGLVTETLPVGLCCSATGLTIAVPLWFVVTLAQAVHSTRLLWICLKVWPAARTVDTTGQSLEPPPEYTLFR